VLLAGLGLEARLAQALERRVVAVGDDGDVRLRGTTGSSVS